MCKVICFKLYVSGKLVQPPPPPFLVSGGFTCVRVHVLLPLGGERERFVFESEFVQQHCYIVHERVYVREGVV